jgi:hypothetical protein
VRFVRLAFALAFFPVAFFFAAFLFAAGFATFAPVVARLECFARARAFFDAASAGALSANEATSATSSATAVFRTIDRPPPMRLR